MTPRVRFAPSPTGYLHVGGARTAIFNWLYARRHQGTFILRIEDTDLERSSEALVQSILEGMAWLGMHPDEGPFFQSHERERHGSDARAVQDAGCAYRCFCSPEEIERSREEAEREGRVVVCARGCRDVAPAESDRRAGAGGSFALRFRVPEGRTEWDDLVHGATVFENSAIEDFVILRSDGSPTYMLSVVSDDIAMRISHVIRGDDHISNTPKQILLYRALGHPHPAFAHLPLILGEDRKRLSKRHGATSVLEYREQGYLPDSVFNFLALLGWSPGDDRQRMRREEMIEAFDFSGVGISPAVFDLKKLLWLNGQYLADLPREELVALVRPRLVAAGVWSEAYLAERGEWLGRVLTLLAPRCRTLAEFPEAGRFLLDPSDDLDYDEEAARKHLASDGLDDLLRALGERLAATEPWEEGPLETTLRDLAHARGIAAGKLIHPVRLAVTGRGESPGLFEVLSLLGRERSLARIDRMLRFLAARGAERA